jgi:hypothetical protein
MVAVNESLHGSVNHGRRPKWRGRTNVDNCVWFVTLFSKVIHRVQYEVDVKRLVRCQTARPEEWHLSAMGRCNLSVLG